LDILAQIKNYAFAEYDWKAALQTTEQDAEYHKEGNVWIHTMMVVESLLNDDGYKALNQGERKLLLLAAILHDIAKPICTRIEDRKIISPNHAVKGEIEARKLLYKHGFMKELFGELNFVEREQVCAMVRYHGLPLLFMEKGEYVVFKASQEIAPKYLCILAKADINGRISNSNTDNLEIVELFRDYCIENDCFENAKAFPSASGRYAYFKNDSADWSYVPYEKDKFPVYMMSGIPAAGKDTYISEHLQGLPVISLDDIRLEMGISPSKNQGTVVQEAKLRAKKLLASKESFVWNATNTTERLRTQIIDLFAGYNAMVNIIYVEAPALQLLKRNAKRTKPVPEAVIHKLIDQLEVPKVWEGHSVTYPQSSVASLFCSLRSCDFRSW